MDGEEMNVGAFQEESGSSTWTRIFVGGIGGGVTADDIRNTFSSLGTVKEIDIVRTNGRNFAYMNFYPNSDHALLKLFSKYNRCIWKGGRLKLERAKEHYLVRLRREWAEDTRPDITTPSNGIHADEEKIVPLEKPRKFQKTHENGLHIYFPKLKKVKSLHLSGTGKHKYSFQRTEVPSLPLIFCDCEQHSDLSPIPTAKTTPVLGWEGAGMKVEEVGLMNSVMNKLFLIEKYPRDVGPTRDDLSADVVKSIQLENGNESDHTVEDNLVMNYGLGIKNMFAMNQDPWNSETETVHGEKMKGKKKDFSLKKRKSFPIDAKERLHSRKSSWKNLVDSNHSNQFSISQIVMNSSGPESHCGGEPEAGGLELDGPEQDCLEFGGPESNRLNSGGPKFDGIGFEGPELKFSGRTWQQKSPWTKLVGKADSCSFSIADIVKPNGSDISKSVSCGTGPAVDQKGGSGGDFVMDLELNVNKSGSSEMVDLERKNENLLRSNEKDWFFMRSDASMKEWARIKAALGGSQRKIKDK